jgi:hypothetical protein
MIIYNIIITNLKIIVNIIIYRNNLNNFIVLILVVASAMHEKTKN